MAKARALDKRRKSIRNIRKITRTMELIARARVKKTMDRAAAALNFTKRVKKLVADLANSGASVEHPLLVPRPNPQKVVVLMLTSNRGLCGGYNASVLRAGLARIEELKQTIPEVIIDVSGKRGISACKFRKLGLRQTFLKFEEKPTFAEVDELATKYLEEYMTGKIDRLEVAYTQFLSISKQAVTVETLLPLGTLETTEKSGEKTTEPAKTTGYQANYELLPSPEAILEEIVPASFKVRLFKCFLDAAVGEQVARMVAMKGATEAATTMIESLSMIYNRARQASITNEIIEIISGVDALNK